MSNLQFYTYPGFGERAAESHNYSQAVRVGDTIQCSGQGGFNPETGVFFREIDAQIDRAFANVDIALKAAGGKGWEQVFRVNSYHIPLNQQAQEAMVRNFKKWMPNHKAIWTCVQVSRLGEDVEVEVQAYDPEGAAKAATKA
ncbi:endoribonuclease L-PSP [Hypoxylon sp. FL1150]|nr:endoribonuclease L-PSP [Hypoxylon sp. FL1150]